jgi:hypothetical protein
MTPRDRKPLIILKALLKGARIKDKDGYIYTIVEDTKYRRLCVIGTQHLSTDPENVTKEVLLGSDMSIDAFLNWCDEIPEEDIIKLVANMALNNDKESPLKNNLDFPPGLFDSI